MFIPTVYKASYFRSSLQTSVNYSISFCTTIWYCVILEILPSDFSREELDTKFSQITQRHMVVL